MVGKVQRLLLGRPLRSKEAQDERLSQSRALGAFGLDALSSVAYGPNEIFYVLVLAGAAGTRFTLPVAVAIRVGPGTLHTYVAGTVESAPVVPIANRRAGQAWG